MERRENHGCTRSQSIRSNGADSVAASKERKNERKIVVRRRKNDGEIFNGAELVDCTEDTVCSHVLEQAVL